MFKNDNKYLIITKNLFEFLKFYNKRRRKLWKNYSEWLVYFTIDFNIEELIEYLERNLNEK